MPYQHRRMVDRVIHTEDFRDARLRPFLRSVLRVMRCQVDVQWWDSGNALLRYVSGYAPKFDGNWNNDWLNNANNSVSAALQMLRAWQPSGSQMIMTLSREDMAFSNVATVSYRAPAYHQETPEWLSLYRQRSLDDEALTCRQWLRRYTVTKGAGGIFTAHLRKKTTLVAVAIEFYRFPKDTFFWQWLLIERRHRSFRDLLPEACYRVSSSLQYLTAALATCSEAWADDVWCREYLEREGHREEYVLQHLAELQAMRYQAYGQISGRLPRIGKLGQLTGIPAAVTLSIDRACVDASHRVALRHAEWRPKP